MTDYSFKFYVLGYILGFLTVKLFYSTGDLVRTYFGFLFYVCDSGMNTKPSYVDLQFYFVCIIDGPFQ